jgi:hypothetical protein
LYPIPRVLWYVNIATSTVSGRRNSHKGDRKTIKRVERRQKPPHFTRFLTKISSWEKH